MAEWYVSLADVVQHPNYGKGATLDEILHDYGMDVLKGYKDDERWTIKCHDKEEVDEYDYYHRSLNGDIVKCPRYVGEARTDGKWKRFVSYFLDLPVEFSGRNLQ